MISLVSNCTTSCVITQDKYNDRLVCATLQVLSVCARVEFPSLFPKVSLCRAQCFLLHNYSSGCLFIPSEGYHLRGIQPMKGSQDSPLSSNLHPLFVGAHVTPWHSTETRQQRQVIHQVQFLMQLGPSRFFESRF